MARKFDGETEAKLIALACSKPPEGHHSGRFVFRRIAQKLELAHTPKHGSWLNVAEIELSVLNRQCLSERIADIEAIEREATAWAHRRHDGNHTIDWRFTTADARIKLKRLYPKISD